MSLEFDRMRAATRNEQQNQENSQLESYTDELEYEAPVQKINTSELKRDSSSESVRLAEETAKRNAEAQSERKSDSSDEMDMTAGITYERKVPRSDTKAQTVGRKAVKDSGLCQIRDFPSSLMKMIKKSMGAESVSNRIALIAFIYANRDPDYDGNYDDIPEEAIILAKTLDRYKTMQSMDKKVRVMESQLRRMCDTSDDIMRAVAYLICDRIGFQSDANVQANRPKDINFAYAAVDEIIDNIEETNDKLKEEARLKSGVPIK